MLARIVACALALAACGGAAASSTTLAGPVDARNRPLPPGLPAAAPSTSLRRRPIDALPRQRLLPPGLHPRTRAAAARSMRAWRAPSAAASDPSVYPVTYGADPTGRTDSTSAFVAAMVAVTGHNTSGHTMSAGIADLGGVVLDLGGGDYVISAPLTVPAFYGNLRIIDGTLRASPSFPPDRYLIEVGSRSCNNTQVSCNENVGMSGLTLDGSHVARGCLLVAATMGATLDSSSAVFGFVAVGVELAGGHEFMLAETWIAQYLCVRARERAGSGGSIAAAARFHPSLARRRSPSRELRGAAAAWRLPPHTAGAVARLVSPPRGRRRRSRRPSPSPRERPTLTPPLAAAPLARPPPTHSRARAAGTRPRRRAAARWASPSTATITS